MFKSISRSIFFACTLITTIFHVSLVYAAGAPAVKNLQVYVLDCGEIAFDNMASFSDTDEYDGRKGHMSDMCVLVGHPHGWLLWDMGVKPKKLDGIETTQKTTIHAQLAKIGLNESDIKYVANSHLHFDHTSSANDFLKSTWLLQGKEWQWANSKPTPLGVDPQTFSQADKAKQQIINGDYDVFGDGKVRLLFAPGHTPGHQVLLVKLDSGKNWLFAGDLYHQKQSRDEKLIPAFNVSRADTMASIDRIEKVAKNQKATLIIQHEMHDFDGLVAFPKYLE